MNKKSILDMSKGAIKERVDYEMAKILDNIMDANTKPTAKRKLTVNIVFTPDDDRENIAIDVTARSVLVPTNPVKTSLYISGSEATGEIQAVEMVPQIPGQLDLNGEEQEGPAVLNIVNFR